MGKLENLRLELAKTQTNYDSKTNENVTEISNLRDKIDKLVQYKNTAEAYKTELLEERNKLSLQLMELLDEKQIIQNNLTEKLTEISSLEIKLNDLELQKNQELVNLKEELQKMIDEKNSEINDLKKSLDEKSEFGVRQKSESDCLSKNILELETTIADINNKLQEQKVSYEDRIKECNCEITILKNKIEIVTQCKDEIITDLKSMIAEKNDQVISLNAEVTQLADDNSRLTEELKETHAELEIGKNELISMREEHEKMVERNECNLSLKNQELRELHDRINELAKQKIDLELSKEKLTNELSLEKEVCVIYVYMCYM